MILTVFCLVFNAILAVANANGFRNTLYPRSLRRRWKIYFGINVACCVANVLTLAVKWS
jgi:hypothetical protein